MSRRRSKKPPPSVLRLLFRRRPCRALGTGRYFKGTVFSLVEVVISVSTYFPPKRWTQRGFENHRVEERARTMLFLAPVVGNSFFFSFIKIVTLESFASNEFRRTFVFSVLYYKSVTFASGRRQSVSFVSNVCSNFVDGHFVHIFFVVVE